MDNLGDHPVFIYRTQRGVLNWQSLRKETWKTIDLEPKFVSNHGASLMDSLVEGRGFALLPIWAVAAELAEGRLQAIDLEDGPLSTSGDTRMAVYLIYHPPKFRLQKVKVTADFLIAELRRETFNF